MSGVIIFKYIESEIDFILNSSNKINSFKKDVAGIFNMSYIESIVDEESVGGSFLSRNVNYNYSVICLQKLANILGFKNSKKYFLHNPKLSTKFSYGERTKEGKKGPLLPRYNILSHRVTDEGGRGVDANYTYKSFDEAMSQEENKALTQREKDLASLWYTGAENYEIISGPSRRGAEAYYASTCDLKDLYTQKRSEYNKIFKVPIKTCLLNHFGNKYHPIIPILAVSSSYGFLNGHHSLYEVLSGAIEIYTELTFENCDIKWLNFLANYSSNMGTMQILNSKRVKVNKRWR